SARRVNFCSTKSNGAERPQSALKLADPLERIAARHLARLQAGRQPLYTLRRSAVRQGVGHDVTLALSLQTIIADRGRRLQRTLHLAGPAVFPLLLRTVGPGPGQAIGLQLDPDLQLVG